MFGGNGKILLVHCRIWGAIPATACICSKAVLNIINKAVKFSLDSLFLFCYCIYFVVNIN